MKPSASLIQTGRPSVSQNVTMLVVEPEPFRVESTAGSVTVIDLMQLVSYELPTSFCQV
jgi:hypothetical protein